MVRRLARIDLMNVLAAKAGLASRLSNTGIARKVETALTFAIRESRRRSALAGISRLRAEAAGLGFELSGAANAVEVMAAREARRAATAARSYARRFWRAAEQSDVTKALEATKGSLRRTAVTESSDAFNTGRKQAVQLVGRQLMRVWDALLDACPICAAEDGKIVGVSENFSIGEPLVRAPVLPVQLDPGHVGGATEMTRVAWFTTRMAASPGSHESR